MASKLSAEQLQLVKWRLEHGETVSGQGRVETFLSCEFYTSRSAGRPFYDDPKFAKWEPQVTTKLHNKVNNNVNEVQRSWQTNQIPFVAGLIPTLRFCEIANEAEKKSQAEFQLLEVFRFYVFICGVGRLVKLAACSASL